MSGTMTPPTANDIIVFIAVRQPKSTVRTASRRMADVPTLDPPGPNFWTYLVVIPTLAATCAGVVTESLPMAAEAYVLVCLGIASLQAPCYVWWVVHVEGNLGMPRFVHIGAGVAELIIVALRMYALLLDFNDPTATTTTTHNTMMMVTTAALVLTCGLMGGAFWTWFFAVQAPHCFTPAALLLLASLASKPEYEGADTEQAVSRAMCGAFVIGSVVAALVHKRYSTSFKDHDE
jgi:hypothetical protein